MIPVKFDGANKVFQPPIGSTDIEPLPVNCGPVACVSCWQVDIAERVRVLLTGKIWVVTKGKVPPPLCLTVDKPPLAESTKK